MAEAPVTPQAAEAVPAVPESSPPPIPPELLEHFAARAAQLGISPHELLRLLLEDFLSGPDAALTPGADHLLARYVALLRWLA